MGLSALAVIAMAVGAEAARAASVSIRPSEEAVTYGNQIRISGRLVTDTGVSPAGRQVTLYERRYPYESSHALARVRTGPQGGYVFRGVEPDYNSRYRVAVNEPDVQVRSKSKLIVVFARGRLSGHTTRDGHAVARFRLRYSPRLPTRLAGRKVLWYFHRIGTRRFTVRDRSRTRQPRRGVLKSKGRWDLPPGRYRYEYAYCIDSPDRRDIGIGPPGVRRDCPRAVPARRARTLRSGAAAAGPLDAGLAGTAAPASALAR